MFWKERCPYELSVRNGHRMRLVFLGFGMLGERLLTYALQDNIFDPGQRIEYHLFGGGAEFVAVHTGLSAIGDPVIVHDEPWYESLPLVEGAQMVIVLKPGGQLKLVRDLLLATTAPLLHVFSAGEAGLELLAGQERLRLFYWERKAWDPAHIFSDVMLTGPGPSTCAMPICMAVWRKTVRTKSRNGAGWTVLPDIPTSAQRTTMRYACI